MNIENETTHTELSWDSSAYPKRLKNLLGEKSPNPLYAAGNLSLLEKQCLGFCGSRKASEKGLDTVRDCARQAAESGVVVVSGNAAGVDFEAHYAALASGGATILVLPEGIENFRARRALREVWSWDRVLVLSQFEPTAQWQAYRAMSRNQLIIALSGAMVVIEAGEKGGTINAGISTLKLHVPLYVAEYQHMGEVAKGNEKLLAMGGKSLRKSASTGLANMSSVFREVRCETNSQVTSPQMTLFQ